MAEWKIGETKPGFNLFIGRHKSRITLFWCVWMLSASPVAAQSDGVNWRLNGYGTVAATITDEDNAEYRVEMTQSEGATSSVDWGLRSKLGVQLSAQLDPQWSVVGQVLAKRRGDTDMDPDLEWFYASYRPASWFDVRAGRMVLPVFMLSDYRPVGFSQPFVEPPGHVYIDASLTQFDGAQLINRFPLGEGSLFIQTSVGSAEVELDLGGGFLLDFDIEDIQNLNIIYEWGNWMLRTGLQRADVEPEFNFIVPPFEDEFSGVGLQYDNGRLLVMAEQVERNTEPAVSKSSAHYILVGWRFGKWLPSIMVAERDRKTNDPFSDSESTALAVRYDIRNDMALKVQWEQASPDTTIWLNPTPAFLFGEDRNIYTLSLDFVF